MSPPRGIRNRNPGNIVVSGWTQRQDGYTGPEPEGRFATFKTMEHGLAALMKLLVVYRESHGLTTVRGIIDRWAPPTENNTSAYVLAVSRALFVDPDETLPDAADTYVALAHAIAAHECGRDAAAAAIGDWDYAKAAAMVFGDRAAEDVPAISNAETADDAEYPAVDLRSPDERAADDFPQPAGATPQAPPTPPPAPAPAAPTSRKEPAMPLPVPALVALGAELLKVIPWGAKRAGRIEEAAPILVEIAKTVVPAAPNEQAAVERVTTDPEARANFVAQAAVRWADLAPALEFETAQRREAREFGEKLMTTGPEWRQIGAGAIISLLSLMIIGGGGALFWTALDSPQLDPGQKGLILGALLAAFTSAVGYWFGSSATSRAKDVTIQEQAARR
jgi:hypothetical protein